jgi:hypothetical protein
MAKTNHYYGFFIKPLTDGQNPVKLFEINCLDIFP